MDGKGNIGVRTSILNKGNNQAFDPVVAIRVLYVMLSVVGRVFKYTLTLNSWLHTPYSNSKAFQVLNSIQIT